MRTQERNPAYQRFSHVLPGSGRYLAKDVLVCWNRDDDRKVRDVEVVFWPEQLVPKPVDDEEFIFKSSSYTDEWDSSAALLKQSPENAFGFLVIEGFADNDELKRALEEFAHIEKCGWARAIVNGFRDK
jgi:hypothetical protein